MMTEHEKYREKLASFMVQTGFATGHGDTFDDLLSELESQVRELIVHACGEKNETET